MHTKLERLLSNSLTTLEVMSYYLVVHTGPGQFGNKYNCLSRPVEEDTFWNVKQASNQPTTTPSWCSAMVSMA